MMPAMTSVTPNSVQVAIAQINCIVGDLEGNSAKILAYAERAAALGADILVTPELSLLGYPPEDLLLRPSLYARTADALEGLANRTRSLPGLYVVVGHPAESHGRFYNAVSVLRDGAIWGTYHKHDLPNYDVFDEQRYFTLDNRPYVFEVKGVRFGINICEDTWFRYAPEAARAAGAQVLLVPNGSPYHMGKQHQRIEVMRENVTVAGLALVYANLVGGQDELVFDGGSFVLNAKGDLVQSLPLFEEALELVQFVKGVPVAVALAPETSLEEQVYRALVLGVRDYVGKNGFPGAIIGLSGGVDSALTLAVAVDALGSEKVRAIMMPSPYTAEISWIDARDMVQRLGVRYDEIGIEPMFDAFRGALSGQFKGLVEDATEENIQARVRGTLLMALSNKTGHIVLTTGNKSEMATGYCTLYGDMAGGFAVIKDILKTLVYRLCVWRNQAPGYVLRDIIPARILSRAPSAELRANQTDQDSLPPYEVLDGIIARYMEEGKSTAQIVAEGFPKADVEHVLHLIKTNEYKRRQAPVGIRVTHRAFGRDWRYPITNRFKE